MQKNSTDTIYGTFLKTFIVYFLKDTVGMFRPIKKAPEIRCLKQYTLVANEDHHALSNLF